MNWHVSNKKCLNNNIVQLSTLTNEDITLVSVNKLKAYRNTIITVIVITIIIIITQDKNKILPSTIPRKIIGGRTQFYQWFKFNKQKVELHHNKNYGGEIITSLPKKWINNHKHQIGDKTTHYDTRDNAICRILGLIPPHKPLWPQIS